MSPPHFFTAKNVRLAPQMNFPSGLTACDVRLQWNTDKLIRHVLKWLQIPLTHNSLSPYTHARKNCVI